MKANVSMIDSAYEALEAQGIQMTFAELWAKVKADLELTDEEANARVGQLYTDLTLDGRFIMLQDSAWDLRSRHTFADVEKIRKFNSAYTAESADSEEDVEDDDENETGEAKSSDSEEGTEMNEGSRAEKEIASEYGEDENKNC